jgi:uncharacterized protein
MFDWDEAKSEANYRERGFDFEFASLIFEGSTLERVDDRKEYGEVRVIAVGAWRTSASPWFIRTAPVPRA